MSFDTNLPPGCSSSDVERHMCGTCVDCGSILNNSGVCPTCGRTYCDECGTHADVEDMTTHKGQILCEKCIAEKLDTIICDLCDLPFPRHQVDRVGLVHICKACRHEHQT